MPEQLDYDSDDSSNDSFNASIGNNNFLNDSYDDDSFDSDRISYSDDSDSEFEEDLIGVNISHSLILWALCFGISHNALTALLMILRYFGLKELPKHAKTLLKTPRKRIAVRPCPPGEAYYYGIQNSLLDMDDSIFENMNVIRTDFFIDGLSVSDSSNWEIWPIMGSFVGRMDLNPYLVHAYAGEGKPKNVDDYVQEFVEEIYRLKETGVLCGKSRVLKQFILRCFICDSPAAAFVTGRISHSSYSGCPRCDQPATRDEANSRLLYPNFAGNPRTDESFVFRDDPNHHRPEFLSRHSSLEEAGVGHVSQFVLDPMHLVDRGNTRRVVTAIIRSLSTINFEEMNNRFLSFRPYVPSEFERKPRTLKQLPKFKANEFKQMLSYTLPVLVKGFVEPEVYQQILILHVGIRLLQDPENYRENLDAARVLINMFVEEYPNIFSDGNFTFSTHCMIHVPDDVEEFGQLYSFSAYRHENHMRVLNRLLRKKNLHLQQFYNRFAEISAASEIEPNRTKKSFQYNSFILKANSLRDGCCMVRPGVPIEITALKENNGIRIIQGQRYLRCENFFEYPVPSIENQGIILASMLSIVEEEFPADDVLHKYYPGMDHLITKKWIVPTSYRQSDTSTRINNTIANTSRSNQFITSGQVQSSTTSISNALNTSFFNVLKTSTPKTYASGKGTSNQITLPNIVKGPNFSSLDIADPKVVTSDQYRTVTINGKKITLMKVDSKPGASCIRSVPTVGGPRQVSANSLKSYLQNIQSVTSNHEDHRDTSKIKVDSFTTKQAEFAVLPKANNVITSNNSIKKGQSNLHRITTPMELSIDEEIPEAQNNDEPIGDENYIRAELIQMRKVQEETLAYVKRLSQKEDDYHQALTFPVRTLEQLDAFDGMIRSKRFRNKLIEKLKKRTQGTNDEDVVVQLVTFIFTPDVLNHFNVTGTHSKKDVFKRRAFKNLRINQVIKDVASLGNALYTYNLTKAVQVMHMRYKRKEEKERARKEAEEDEADQTE